MNPKDLKTLTYYIWYQGNVSARLYISDKPAANATFIEPINVIQHLEKCYQANK